MRDGRIGQHPLDVGLGDGDQIAQTHRKHGQDDQHPLPVRVQGVQTIDQHPHCQREGGDLGRAAQDQHGRGRPALIDVGHPHVEGHGAELEADADHQEGDAEYQHFVRHALFGDRRRNRCELDRAGRAIDHRDAIEQQTRAERAEHEVFHRGLGALAGIAVEGDQGIEGERLEFETQIEGQEAVGRDHDQHSEHGQQSEDIELADQHPAILEPGARIDEGQDADDEDCAPEQVGHGVADQVAVEEHLSLAAADEAGQRDGDHQTEQGQAVVEALVLVLEVEIQDQHHARGHEDGDLGQDGE